MPTSRRINHGFFKTWSPEMAYVLGYFAADGSMIEHQSGGKYIEFTSTDAVLLDIVKRVTKSKHKVSQRKRRNPVWKVQHRIQIGSKEWFNDLLILGFTPNKSKRLQLPVIPEEYFGSFLRGYFDGDGCVFFNRVTFSDRQRWILIVLFTSGSRTFLEEIWATLRKHGVKGGYIRTKQRGFDLQFSHHDSLAIYRLMYNTAQVADLYLPRKREKLERAIQTLQITMRP